MGDFGFFSARRLSPPHLKTPAKTGPIGTRIAPVCDRAERFEV
jgi:hypothetical protein